MRLTRSAHTQDDRAAVPVRGLRILTQRRLFPLADLEAPETSRKSAFVGRDRNCALWLADETVSTVHGLLIVEQGGYVFRDFGSKNGTHVSRGSARGPFVRVQEIRLEVGMYLRLGDVQLAVVDQDGRCPLQARDQRELITEAQALYGSERETARVLGISSGRVRRLLGRLVAR